MRFAPLTPVIKNLIILNVLVFIAVAIMGPEVQDYLSLHHWKSPKFEPIQLVSHFFMHGGIWHIAFNMFMLYMFGSMVEQRWGPKLFLSFYMVCALGAALIYLGWTTYELSEMEGLRLAMLNTGSESYFYEFDARFIGDASLTQAGMERLGELRYFDGTNLDKFTRDASSFMGDWISHRLNGQMVGASGAIYGVLMAFGMCFPNMQMMLLIPPIPIKAKYLVIGLGAIAVFSAFANNPNDTTAHFAHLGGMIFGFILIKVLKLN